MSAEVVEAVNNSGAHGGPDLIAVVVLLAAAVIAVPVFRRLGLGSVLGYLAAGLAIGPFGMGFFHEAQSILHVAELGVVLFLFIIGLEMQPSRLWAMRADIFGLGLLQVGIAIAALVWVGLALGYPVVPSFVAGTGFVLTSTAIVMQMLTERNSMAQPKGRRMVAILLLEDLAIVPLLALVAFLAPGGAEATLSDRLTSVGIGLAAITILVIAGRYLLDPMFRLLARFGAREVMTAAALLVVFGAAILMQAGGLSMAMGAFLAGVLLSESSFRHQLEADIEPFRGLLLGLFFLSVGMVLDLDTIVANWGVIAISVPAYIVLKMGVIYAVARALKTEKSEALERAVLMAQGGEFAFVLYATATQFGILTPEWNANLTAVIICSMALTPLMIILHDRFAPKPTGSMDGVDAVRELSGNVLLIGFGRMGQIISQPLLARGYTLSIIDTDAQAIQDASVIGFKVWYGDGARLDILHAAGAANANLIIAAPNDRAAVTKIVELAKHEFPMVPVLARAYDRQHALELVQAGAEFQLRETLESSFAMGKQALLALGVDPKIVDEVMETFRERDVERFALECVGGIFAGRDLIIGNSKTQH
ncbi:MULTISPECIES: monovalent cation:proton antiporter-2 (CPA2) family protein [Rhizobium/Agrobacterium group]|uniref:monovalent cation:proton antiporter-2 (CPA2) family protein n=1 Tax=Rhizobium/Agrobacterium group TaxID=227290 RepID=UPI000714C19E|nr:MULTISPECIES: monovalent cation:proton antiporter-2 (CPA2) family protein [Rhizobium/Agrobacterium group]KQY49473.1 potassium transporter [Rhizobium sp. Root491]NTA45551.1 potassium transporter [Agrobacterium tumefaciens]NTA84434.1 potassium transporter [Agrobacterium tumefaciens]QTQ86203.1 cation:proton antiporter [Agrobacterium tumefaciens]UXT84654.1 potassium transporter [Agrobacterium tumefaciens]